MCMSLRGVQKFGARTVTSALHGLVRDDARTRQEFLALTTGSAHDQLTATACERLHEAGVSIWLDMLSRDLLDSGDFAALIADSAVTGATSNPTIFAKAITGSDAYDDQIRAEVGVRRARHAGAVLRARARRRPPRRRPAAPDLRRAADGRDGFVSFECTPDLADDTAGTIEQALMLWERLARPNVMIKVPATAAGIGAIEELTARGVNVNVTLLFSVERYEQVIDAYLDGPAAARVARASRSVAIASVASFFVSRVDTKADALLARRLGAARPRGRSPTPSAPTAATASASPASAGRRCAPPARAPSGRCGRARGRRTPPTPTCSTSRS